MKECADFIKKFVHHEQVPKKNKHKYKQNKKIAIKSLVFSKSHKNLYSIFSQLNNIISCRITFPSETISLNMEYMFLSDK